MSIKMNIDGKLVPISGPATTTQIFPGFITMGANFVAPTGWLLCDGTAYSKTEYADLFNVIGETYNKPNTPADKFCVPDLKDKYVMGAGNTGVGTNIDESLPNIKGTLGRCMKYGDDNDFYKKEGAFLDSDRKSNTSYGSGDVKRGLYFLDFKASNSHAAYKDGAKVRPDSVVLNYFIKY